MFARLVRLPTPVFLSCHTVSQEAGIPPLSSIITAVREPRLGRTAIYSAREFWRFSDVALAPD
jgi:hypothetical protein